MAYNEILDTQLDPDAPITSTLGYQFRDNTLEIASGTSNAPRVSALALGPIVDSDPNLSTNAGGNDLATIDIGAIRESVVQYSFIGDLNTGPNAGSSEVVLRASDDNVTWVDLVTMVDSTGSTVESKVNAIYDGRGGTAYRYYAIRAQGDNDHDITGSALISLMGTAD